MASRLGKHPFRVNLRLDTLVCFLFFPDIFFNCCLDAPWLSVGYYWGNSGNHLMLITAIGLSIFGPRLTRRGWSLHLIERPVGFDHNGTTHLAIHPKLQKILSPDLHSDFTKCENVPNTCTGENSQNTPNGVQFNSQLAKEKVIA